MVELSRVTMKEGVPGKYSNPLLTKGTRRPQATRAPRCTFLNVEPEGHFRQAWLWTRSQYAR